MALNSNITQLDSGQIIKRLFDVSNDAIRMVLAEATGIAIELSRADGDSVAIAGDGSSTKASLTNANTGVVLAAQDCSGMKSFNVYTKTTSTITGPQLCTVEISPSDSEDVWIATTLTITPSTTLDVVVMGTALSNIVAKRVRVSIASAITTGSFDLFLVQQGV